MSLNTKRRICQSKTSRVGEGFTLIEMIVSIGLFSVVMLISMGSLLSLIDATRKAQSLQSVVNNLNVSLDGMARAIRAGSGYHCGTGSYATVNDCPNGDTTVAFEHAGGNQQNPSDQWVYQYDSGTKRIYRSQDSGSNWLPITAAGISIERVRFYVVGSQRGDTTQPKVVIEIKGIAGQVGSKTSTEFQIQSSAVQRALDL